MTHYIKHKQKRNQGFTPTPFSAMLPKATRNAHYAKRCRGFTSTPKFFGVSSQSERGFTLTPQHGVMSRAFSKIKLLHKYITVPKYSLCSVRRHKSTTPCLVSGFTLVEVLVSFAIFSLVITGSIGAMASVIDANRKTQALQLVINNLNFALESMTRTIRIGYQYHCTSDIPGNLSTFAETRDCSGGGTYLALESSQGNRSNDLDQIVFRHIGTRIERSTDSGQSWFSITAAEVLINELRFVALGTDSSDNRQPIVTIIINGSSGINLKSATEFRIQTSVSQRLVDF